MNDRFPPKGGLQLIEASIDGFNLAQLLCLYCEPGFTGQLHFTLEPFADFSRIDWVMGEFRKMDSVLASCSDDTVFRS